jgi:hypothetical protein
MEAHSAVPQLEQFERLRPQVRFIERRIAQPAAEDHADRAIEEQIVRMALGERGSGGLDLAQGMPIGEDDADKIGQAVPAQGEAPQTDAARQTQVKPVNRFAGRSQ